jgi:hypothetical protein
MKKKVLVLRPTQVSLGMKEVEDKVRKLHRMNAKRRLKYIKDRTVPVVMGPLGEVYLIDNHHFTRACWEIGIKHVFVRVVADLSDSSVSDFWKFMLDKSWVHPYSQYGNKINISYNLPDNIKGLADDPYRSLAWMVREKGGFDKVSIPFSELKWANYFRYHMTRHPRTHGYGACVKQALKLCRKNMAKDLPGFKK